MLISSQLRLMFTCRYAMVTPSDLTF